MIVFSCLRAGPRRSAPSAIILLAFSAIFYAPAVRAGHFDCRNSRCGLLTDGPYRQYVIGRLSHVATGDELRKVYRWAKQHGYWQSLPEDFSAYNNDTVMVSILPSRRPGASPVTVFMQRSEYLAAPVGIGDLVRYTPHTSDLEAPKGDATGMVLFQGLTGCVATLCSRGDQACKHRYVPGLYTKTEGMPISREGDKRLVGEAGIDPVSLLPKE